MPRFDLQFAAEAKTANEIVMAGEASYVREGFLPDGWTPKRLEFLYELAYLRAFSAWEETLEAILIRSLCGFASSAGQEIPVLGAYFRTLADAEAALLAGRPFLLWHDSGKVISRCRAHVDSTLPAHPALQERTIASNQARLDAFAHIRHRVVHEQNDARAKFNTATLMIAGQTYREARPGKFLRDVDSTVAPPRKWLETIVLELQGMLAQMV
jgi:hypothetical protein